MRPFFGYPFKRLNTKLFFFLLIPVSLLVMGGGRLSFVYTRNLMLEQWNESAVLRLSRAAHDIEMRLTAPLDLLNAVFEANLHQDLSGRDLIRLLRSAKGVEDVRFLPDAGAARPEQPKRSRGGFPGMGMRGYRSRVSAVSAPVYDPVLGRKTIAMTVQLSDREQTPLGRLVIQMGFDYLLQDVFTLGWLQSDAACLVTGEGAYLAHTDPGMDGRKRLGESGDLLEKRILNKMAGAVAGTAVSGERPPERIGGFHTLGQVPWVVVLFGNGKKVLYPIILYRNLFFAGCLVLAVFLLILIRLNTGRLVKDICMISDKAGEVAQGNYPDPLPVSGRDEISRLVESYNTMVTGLKEKDFIRDSFGRYVDPEFAKQLMERPDIGRLGGERREVAILMSDLRGFTPLSEAYPPETIIEVLNLYFSRMIELIQAHQGIIVDFFGDAVLVFFDPLDGAVGKSADQALACAGDMQAAMAAVNLEIKARGLPKLTMGIGLHTGPVVVGNIGSAARAKYGIVGSAVNITSRIQAKAGQGETLISSPFLSRLPECPPLVRSFDTDLKGISGAVTLHAPEIKA